MALNDPAALDAFLDEPRNVIVVGVRADGRPHATPNWFVWRDGRFHISTTKDRAKYRIFSNDPRAQLVIDDATGFRYAIVEGTVAIVEDVDDELDMFAAIRAKHGRPTVSQRRAPGRARARPARAARDHTEAAARAVGHDRSRLSAPHTGTP